MFIALFIGLSLGWLFWKAEDILTQKRVQKEEKTKVLASENKHLNSNIKSQLKKLKQEKKAYKQEYANNQALHNKYLNDFETFKKEIIDEYVAQQEKKKEVDKKKEEEKKIKKQQYAKKHLYKGGSND